MTIRRSFLSLLPLAAAVLAIGRTAGAQAPVQHSEKAVVGAIRWDAWHGDRGGPGRAVQHSLSPKEWRYRLPFFAEVRGDDAVRIDGASQEVMDREIAFAKTGGLDYWAFVTYPENDAMSLGLKLYLSSTRRADVKFCLVTEADRWRDPAFVRRLVSLLREPGYQTVTGGRPLLYLGFITPDAVERNWGGIAAFRKAVDDFRAAVVAEGLKTPYIVIMDFSPVQGKRWLDDLGCDALSSYAIGSQGKGIPFAELAQRAESFWDICKSTGAQVVPIVTAGWDRRPRIARPVPWEKHQKPGVGIDVFVQTPTPAELAVHTRHALEWIRANPAHAPARAALIYAWNENDEGGWLVPTLTEGSARLDALSVVLRKGK